MVGSAIAATTAASLTTAFGELYIAVLSRLFEQSGGEPPSAHDIAEAFAAELRRLASRLPGSR